MGGGGGGGTQFHHHQFRDPQEIFKNFFGTNNPFESFYNIPGMGGHQVSEKNIKCTFNKNYVLILTHFKVSFKLRQI